jgi:hypothetical protein
MAEDRQGRGFGSLDSLVETKKRGSEGKALAKEEEEWKYMY